MTYDLLIVGAGLTAATICAKLKHKYKICVVDIRDHIGGNCYDSPYDNNTYIHNYGPHIFHSKHLSIINFLSQYTNWKPIKYSVLAEIIINNKKIRVPFPYSQETEKKLGYKLSLEEIKTLFFKTYSQKMWQTDFKDLPIKIQNRIPKKNKKSNYFLGEFQAVPQYGYTKMIQNMFSGVEIILNVHHDYWKTISTKNIVYCGRIDKIITKNKTSLDYMDINIIWTANNEKHTSSAINFCHNQTSYTRQTNYGYINQNLNCKIISQELPYKADLNTISPAYPFISKNNIKKYNALKKQIKNKYPKIYFLGRLGKFKYLNMDTAVKGSLSFCENFLNAS